MLSLTWPERERSPGSGHQQAPLTEAWISRLQLTASSTLFCKAHDLDSYRKKSVQLTTSTAQCNYTDVSD
jgi:hypothetical protein